MTEYRHPSDGDVYTPMTPEIYELLAQLKREHRTWRRVAYLSQTRLKVLRNIRRGRRKVISMRLLDRILTGCGHEYELNRFTWFTADDLVALGIWKPVQYVEGRKRIRAESRLENDKKMDNL